jgi:hypothetical protein
MPAPTPKREAVRLWRVVRVYEWGRCVSGGLRDAVGEVEEQVHRSLIRAAKGGGGLEMMGPKRRTSLGFVRSAGK